MDALTLTAPTMTSREIADLVDSRHDKVKQSIERLAARGAIALPPVGEYLDSLGRPAEEYRISKRDSYVIVAQLSPEFTARLVDRWQELESKVAHNETFVVPQTFAQALMLAAQQAAQIEQQQVALTLAAPAVAFVDRFVQADGLKGFREVCKLLKANESRFTEFVLSKKIMYRLAGKLTAHQPHIDAGRFEVRAGIAATNEHAYTTTKFTSKGVQWIAGEWAKYCLTLETEAV